MLWQLVCKLCSVGRCELGPVIWSDCSQRCMSLSIYWNAVCGSSAICATFKWPLLLPEYCLRLI
ncbi:hypothetical protein F751_4074 [Auxenochlorella protothecoides]|uniref:Uncharacterized protein n=2 Tax=Auxenochlorella protothecoides TaxID=3075 RepID=A0A087ST56_AUXPR|nr:hypothetical protein F751_4074 [Auxenochlorella protothecoides]KFM28910.1 hypothetical protein F751_4074 [Auxenochlorella protothecoides]